MGKKHLLWHYSILGAILGDHGLETKKKKTLIISWNTHKYTERRMFCKVMNVKTTKTSPEVVNSKLEKENSSWSVRDVRTLQREYRPNLEEGKICLENSGQSREGKAL